MTAAYGNPKLLLKKKITEISRIGQLWKVNDLDKLAEALSWITNTMKDLERIASEHGIESKLYSSNGIERIYQCLGNNRVTRWGESYDDETLWTKLIDFSEKDLRVQQQKVLISTKWSRKYQLHEKNVDGK